MKETCQGPQNSIFKKNLNENNDFDDENYKFFGKKIQGRNKGSKTFEVGK